MSLAIQITNFFAKAFQATLFRETYSPQTTRRNMDLIAGVPLALLKRKPSTEIESIDIDGLAGELISTGHEQKRILLLLHGGSYCMGTLRSFRKNAWEVSRECNAKVLHIEYRLAPEAPWPAALEDAKKAYRFLLRKYPGQPISLGGVSAGGGLALALVLALRDENEKLPEKVFAVCPWSDLTCSGESIERNKYKDFWLTPSSMKRWSGYYVQNADPKNPHVSPIFANFKNFPPLLIFCGDQEILLSDAEKVYELAKSAGTKVEFHLGRNMQHVWFLAFPFLDESRLAFSVLKKFMGESL